MKGNRQGGVATGTGCRIVMIGPHGERDYVEKILDGGCPCICGAEKTFAALYHPFKAEMLAKSLRTNWLSPHVGVEVEPVSVPQ